MNNTRHHSIGLGILVASVGMVLLSGCTATSMHGGIAAAGQVSGREDVDEEGTMIVLSDAPEAVRAAVAGFTTESSVKQVVRETDDGVTTYDVEYTKDGVQWAAEVSSDGAVVENELDDEHGDADDED